MFSPQIQNYINSSSQAQAFSRVNELNRYIDSFYPKETIEANKTDVFKEILATSQAQIPSNSVFNVDTTPKIETKEKISPLPFGSLSKIQTNEIKNTQQTPKTTIDTKSKEAIMSYIKEASEKHGVEEKLIKALIKQTPSAFL